MKIFLLIFFAFCAPSLKAQLLPGDIMRDDSIPQQFSSLGIMKYANADGVQTSLLTFSATGYSTFSRSRSAHIGVNFTTGGLNTGQRMEGLVTIMPSARYTFFGLGDFGVYVSAHAGIIQTLSNPFSNLSQLQFAHTGWGAAAWGGTYVKLFNWLPPVELSVGYWYMNLEKNYTLPSAQLSLIF
jgi:hypothetical protein